ncbi:MAG: hypothetical protein LBK60_12145, partial [Verrucomicrobiales bacterium]|nr:hypothetical protein [Verrucomicrobiales bacterium]
MKLLRRVRGSGTLFYRGLAIDVKDVITVEPNLDPFDVESDAWSAIDRRKNNSFLTVQFTPIGVVNLDALNVLLPFRSFMPGQYNTPVLGVSAVSDGVLTSVGHGLRDGDGLIVGKGSDSARVPQLSGADLPEQLYYAHAVDANTLKLYATRADALAHTNPLALTAPANGLYRCRAQAQCEFVLWTQDNLKLTVHNAAVSQMPKLNLTAGDTFWGQATVEGYRRADVDSAAALPAGQGLLYTLTEEPYPGSQPNAAQIPTVPYTVTFTPADGQSQVFELRDPLTVDFDLTNNDVNVDRIGLLCRSISNLSATATLVPVNRDAFDLLDAVTAQNQERGTSLPYGQLDIAGPNNAPYLRLFGAQLTAVPLNITSGDDRVGEI